MNELALFAGAGGGILGGKLLGWTTVCAVERDAYAASVLARRQDDGLLSPFPIWSDVCSFDGGPWRGIVDVVSGGFPCQDISAAGKGAGIEGARSGLWSQFARIIGEVGPRYVFVENSPMLVSRGLGVVLGDLAALGYDARWCVLGAVHAGAPHKRERIWIVAHATGEQHQGSSHAKRRTTGAELPPDTAQHGRGSGRARRSNPGGARQSEQPLQDVAHASRIQQGRSIERPERERARPSGESIAVGHADRERELQCQGSIGEEWGRLGNPSWWVTEPDVGRVAHGVAARVDRLKALGNGQVPAVAALAWSILTQS
jgi:DNA (cytosine-5)-methyltransferase 1